MARTLQRGREIRIVIDLSIYMQAALSFGFLFGLFFATQPLAPKFTMRKLHLFQGVIWLYIILFIPPFLMSIGAAPARELLSAFTLLWALSLPFYAIGIMLPIAIFWVWRKIRGDQRQK